MTDLKWIPLKPGQYLQAGTYFILRPGMRPFAATWTQGFETEPSYTHYCPIPEPELEPQDCPFCNRSALLFHGFPAEFYCYCSLGSCSLEGPRGSTKAEAIAAWNRITLRDL